MPKPKPVPSFGEPVPSFSELDQRILNRFGKVMSRMGDGEKGMNPYRLPESPVGAFMGWLGKVPLHHQDKLLKHQTAGKAINHVLDEMDRQIERLGKFRRKLRTMSAYIIESESLKVRLGDIEPGGMVVIPLEDVFPKDEFGTTKIGTPATIMLHRDGKTYVCLPNIEGITINLSSDKMVLPYKPGDNLEHPAFGSGEDD